MDLVGAPLSRFMGLESMKLAFGNRVSPSESQPKVWGSLPVFPFKARLQFFYPLYQGDWERSCACFSPGCALGGMMPLGESSSRSCASPHFFLLLDQGWQGPALLCSFFVTFTRS